MNPKIARDTISALEPAGIKKGDSVYIGSDMQHAIMHFIRKYGDSKPKDILDSILDALISIVGEEGTLVIPVFNWDFCEGKPFDYRKTKGKVGALGNAALKHEAFRRTKHPFYSCAIYGADQKLLCESENMDAFGHNSFWEYLLKTPAIYLSIDAALDKSGTFIHYVEQCNAEHIPYRFMKIFTSTYIDEEGKESIRQASMFVRDYDRDPKNSEQMRAFPESHDVKICEFNALDSEIIVFDFEKIYREATDDIINNRCKDICEYVGQDS